MRGIYTAGVLDFFLEKGLHFDGVIGVSAGAAHACSFLSAQKGRSLRYHKRYCADPRFMSLRSFFKTGNLVGVDFCYPDMKEQIDCVRASASLPYVSKPVEIDGKKLLDGGCTDGVPVEAFRKMGYARNVVILTRPADYVARPAPRFLAKLFYRKYPAFVKALNGNHNRYNQTMARIAQMEREGEIFVIRPAERLRVGNLESHPDVLQRAYDLGRADAEHSFAKLTAWLERQCNKEREVYEK